jgi:hypothetical protein
MKFKHKEDQMFFSLLHPALIMIYADLYLHAKQTYGIELVITDTVSTPLRDKEIGRQSTSHAEGRAIDIRTKNIDVFIVNELVNWVNTRWAYQQYHYLSKTNVKRLAYYHTHNGEHIHMAIHSKYKVHNIQKKIADLGN